MRAKSNPVARVLRDPKFRPRVVVPRKGSGASARKPSNRRPDQRQDGGFDSRVPTCVAMVHGLQPHHAWNYDGGGTTVTAAR